jgi:hypothetical protein
MTGQRVYGRVLSHKYSIGAKQSRYRETGDFYECLTKFPGALWDPDGYVMFETKEHYDRSPYLQIGVKLHVPGGIAAMPSYVRIKETK